MRKPILIRIVCCLALVSMFSGSSNAQEVKDGYGKQKGKEFSKSVNGTSALIELFRIKGHTVTTWGKISPRIDKFDTLIWFPGSFDVPSDEAIDRLNSWLANGNQRTLIYVGRDFDAEIHYWQEMLARASIEEKATIQRRLASAQSEHSTLKSSVQPKQDCTWFEMDATRRSRQVTTLNGDWSSGVDASKTNIWLDTRISPGSTVNSPYQNYNVTKLLNSGQDVIVMRITSNFWGSSSQLIVVNNSSFLVNAGLVNQENRKLAGKLVDACQPNGDVMFLESDRWGIRVQDKEAKEGTRRANEWLGIWPLNLIVFHFLGASILFMFTYFPIFGRPRKLKEESTADFSNHIESLGQLVRRTGDQQYALSRIEYYQQHVKRDSGSEHMRS